MELHGMWINVCGELEHGVVRNEVDSLHLRVEDEAIRDAVHVIESAAKDPHLEDGLELLVAQLGKGAAKGDETRMITPSGGTSR